jgi:hypothetical protein
MCGFGYAALPSNGAGVDSVLERRAFAAPGRTIALPQVAIFNKMGKIWIDKPVE